MRNRISYEKQRALKRSCRRHAQLPNLPAPGFPQNTENAFFAIHFLGPPSFQSDEPRSVSHFKKAYHLGVNQSQR